MSSGNKVRAKGPHQGELVNKVVYDRLKGRVAVIASGGINLKKSLEALENADLVVGLFTTHLSRDPEFCREDS